MSDGGDAPDYPARLNIAARLLEGALDRGWGDRPAFHYRGTPLAYAQVRERASRWAGALRRLGTAPEQRVVVALPDAPDFVAAFLGTIWRGAVAVPVNPYLPHDSYSFYLRDSRAVTAVVAPWVLDAVLEAAPQLPGLRHVIVCDEPAHPAGGPDDGSWRSRLAHEGPPRVHEGSALVSQAPAMEAAETHCDEPAFWLYTSGSTGSPKAAIHLQHDIWVAAENWGRRTLGLGPEHVHLSASKLFFAYGLGNSLLCPLWSGGCAVLEPDKPMPANMAAAIIAHGVSHFYAVPSFYGALLAEPSFAQQVADGALASLQVCVSAGETLPAPLWERWTELTGVPLLDGIGSTELLHIFIANRADDIRPGCSGRPIAGYEARVADEAGHEVGDDVVGDLWVRGDSACAGYWNRHADTKRAVRGEWFVTGDKYLRDAEGYYWYSGRADDMFKVHGKWVSPHQVESALLGHEAVREVAVVAGTDDGGLSCAIAYVVAAQPRDGLEQVLLQHARERLSSFQVPARIVLLDELPKTPTGKIRRYALRGS
jgi:benzoate-CoA ligase